MMCVACEEKDEKIRQLEAELYNRDWFPPSELGLTGLEISILQAFMARPTRYLTRDFIIDLTRGAFGRLRKEEVEYTIVNVYISKLRRKLRPFHLAVETKNSVGWRLDPNSAHRLLHWNDHQERAA